MTRTRRHHRDGPRLSASKMQEELNAYIKRMTECGKGDFTISLHRSQWELLLKQKTFAGTYSNIEVNYSTDPDAPVGWFSKIPVRIAKS